MTELSKRDDSDSLRPDASDSMALAFLEATDRRTTANYELATSNFANVWPWRILKWLAINREVKREAAVIHERIRQGREWRRAHARRTGVRFETGAGSRYD